MHKYMVLLAQLVGKLFRVCDELVGLCADVKNTVGGGVYKSMGLCGFYTTSSWGYIHRASLVCVSVKARLLHINHSTYNKLQLVKVNNLLLIGGVA